MLVIKKIELGYGIFEGDRLITFVDRQEDYAGLVDTVINVNTKIEIKRVKSKILDAKELLSLYLCSVKHSKLAELRSYLHFLENYNV